MSSRRSRRKRERHLRCGFVAPDDENDAMLSVDDEKSFSSIATPSDGPRLKDVARKPRRVLVVDDVEDNREIYVASFRHAGFDVEEAVDGSQALDIVKRWRPDAVIMDLAMPKLDGWSATRMIKTSSRAKKPVVIVVTGHVTTGDLDRARATGADEICSKPCLPQDLIAKVNALLQRQAQG
jgi:two-component system, cell cycle response regulator DivK